MNKAIIIGASSGIGRELAKILDSHGYNVGIAGRRLNLLRDLQSTLTNNSYIKQIDVSVAGDAQRKLKELINRMGSVNLIVISAGVGYINPDLDWPQETETIAVNVVGFAAITNVAFNHFKEQGYGHLVGISSIAALRGSDEAPAYNASKAFISNYLEGLRKKVVKTNIPIRITEIQPGLVDTAMAKGDGLFWVATPQKAAYQIFEAIEEKKAHAYITRRWRVIAWLLKILPEALYQRI